MSKEVLWHVAKSIVEGRDQEDKTIGNKKLEESNGQDNSLAYGVSRTSYYFAKSAVVLTIALFQFLVSYGLVFLIATLYNGLGTLMLEE